MHIIRNYNTQLMPLPKRCFTSAPLEKVDTSDLTRKLLGNDNLRFTEKGRVLVDEHSDEGNLKRYMESGVDKNTSMLHKKEDNKQDAIGFNQLIETKENDMIRESLSVSQNFVLTLIFLF
jgi:Cft2 family RNA processing exonuclease